MLASLSMAHAAWRLFAAMALDLPGMHTMAVQSPHYWQAEDSWISLGLQQ